MLRTAEEGLKSPYEKLGENVPLPFTFCFAYAGIVYQKQFKNDASGLPHNIDDDASPKYAPEA